ncbi:MAG: SpoIIE family protein phosphatase [Oscillospiraceae bacterium]|nr:SpoIIE family protein phosphatase [Oscillospiraceae bacterium]
MTENKGIIKIDRYSKTRESAAVKAVSYAVRFVLGFVMGCAEIFGDLAPFGVGFTASGGDVKVSAVSMAGAILGYIAGGSFMSGLKYISASLLVFTAAQMLKKWPHSQSVLFAPGTAFFVTAVFSVACDLMANPTISAVALCVCDAVLAAAGAYFFKIALSGWTGKLSFTKSEDIRHTVSVMLLLSVIVIALCKAEILEMIALGRVLSVLTVLLFAFKGGAGLGCAAGTALGLAIDAAAGMFWYTALYSLVGMISGIFSKQGRAYFTVTAILTCGTVTAFQIYSAAVPGCLYEMFIASVVFVLLPNGFMNRLEAYLPSAVTGYGEQKTREYMKKRIQQAADAFTMLYETVRDAVGLDRNDSDIAAVFDAAAERICRNCRNSHKCWGSEYETTLNALNGVSGKMLSEGKLLTSDLPEYFTERCSDIDDFTYAVSDELRGLAYRRQYRAKLLNNQKAAFGQYADMSSILSGFSKEMEKTAGYEPGLETRLKKYLKSKNIAGDVAVYKGTGGRVRAEISHAAASKLKRSKNWLDELSAVLGMRLCTGEGSRAYAVVMEAEPLTAAVGIAAVNKGSSYHSGDKSTYFKTDEGALYVILSDGMGTGREAEKYSKNAISILETFLKSGVNADAAMRILNDLMLLKNQNETDCCTVDLVSINLFSGKTTIFKYGAAASYLKYDDEVERITGTSLAAGLGFPPQDSPDKFKVDMHPGTFAVMVSDGVTSGGSDNWLFDLLEKYDGTDPKELAGMIVRYAVKLYGDQDDMTAFVIYVSERK